MKIDELRVDPKDITKNMTMNIRVTGLRWFKIKLVFASFLIVLGAWLVGIKINWVKEQES